MLLLIHKPALNQYSKFFLVSQPLSVVWWARRLFGMRLAALAASALEAFAFAAGAVIGLTLLTICSTNFVQNHSCIQVPYQIDGAMLNPFKQLQISSHIIALEFEISTCWADDQSLCDLSSQEYTSPDHPSSHHKLSKANHGITP